MPLELSLAEWTVLALIDEAPAHGFAVARVTGPGGDLGRVWQVPRPVVYRALARLEDAGLAVPVGEEPGHGPQRRVFAATPAGSTAVARWLTQPVQHVRDLRSHLLTKLALLDRRGQEPADLLERQRAVLTPITQALSQAERTAGPGFEATLATWRRVNATAALTFLDDV